MSAIIEGMKQGAREVPREFVRPTVAAYRLLARAIGACVRALRR